MSQPRMTAPAGGASFSIDLDRAPQAIADLEDARDQLQDLIKEAASLGKVEPPAQDPVSRDAAYVLGEIAAGDRPGTLITALKGGVEHLNGLIGNLKSELASYQTNEESSTSLLRKDAETT